MLIIPIIILAVVLFILLSRPRRAKPIVAPPTPDQREARRGDGIIYGETPDGLWQGGSLPDDFTPGGGDFGGGGSSSSWDTPASGGDDGGSGGGGGGGD